MFFLGIINSMEQIHNMTCFLPWYHGVGRNARTASPIYGSCTLMQSLVHNLGRVPGNIVSGIFFGTVPAMDLQELTFEMKRTTKVRI
jgi:hypothetical protein